jgi:hypothetical protein
MGEEAFYNGPASLEKNLTPQIVDRSFETLMPKGITQYMYDRDYSLNFYSS